jgi:copper oxidase (laccase) domain-containing protein
MRAEKIFNPNGNKDWFSPKIHLFGKPNDLKDPDTFARLGRLLNNYKIKTLYAPDPSEHNTVIAPKSQFRRNKKHSFPLYNGVIADGIVLEKAGDAAVILSADCPTIVVWNPRDDPKNRKVIVAHGGRDSLLDPHIFRGFSKSRNHGSVVDSIIKEFNPSDRQHLSVFTTLGIEAEYFTHHADDPEFGKQNRHMIEHVMKYFGPKCIVGPRNKGGLDLHQLIRVQFHQNGVPHENINRDRHDTCDERRVSGGYRWSSHRRGEKSRNAVMVLHNVDQSLAKVGK